MCHDINPLGTTFHLKELDRRALAARQPFDPDRARQKASPARSSFFRDLLAAVGFFKKAPATRRVTNPI